MFRRFFDKIDDILWDRKKELVGTHWIETTYSDESVEKTTIPLIMKYI